MLVGIGSTCCAALPLNRTRDRLAVLLVLDKATWEPLLAGDSGKKGNARKPFVALQFSAEKTMAGGSSHLDNCPAIVRHGHHTGNVDIIDGEGYHLSFNSLGRLFEMRH